MVTSSDIARSSTGLALVLVSLAACRPQEGPPKATEAAVQGSRSMAYLGLDAPGMTAEVFTPDVLSGVESGACSGFLLDGTVFVFKQLSPDLEWKFEPVFFTELVNGQWSDPAVAPFSDLYPYNYTVAADGKTLVFTSLRSAEDHSVILRRGNIWTVEKTDSGWSDPQMFGPPVNTEDTFENYPSISADGTLYYMSGREGGMGSDDIYRLDRVNGEYVEPENIGGPVNTENSEVDSFIGADESYLIYSSDGLDGLGRHDLYVSFRTRGGSWSEPVNMGPAVNSPASELRASVTPDRKYFFFTSDRSGSGKIYWMDAGIIQSLRPDNNPG